MGVVCENRFSSSVRSSRRERVTRGHCALASGGLESVASLHGFTCAAETVYGSEASSLRASFIDGDFDTDKITFISLSTLKIQLKFLVKRHSHLDHHHLASLIKPNVNWILDAYCVSLFCRSNQVHVEDLIWVENRLFVKLRSERMQSIKGNWIL